MCGATELLLRAPHDRSSKTAANGELGGAAAEIAPRIGTITTAAIPGTICPRQHTGWREETLRKDTALRTMRNGEGVSRWDDY